MPKLQTITNPQAAYTPVTDYRLGVDGVGADLDFGERSEQFVATAAIAKGAAVYTTGTAAAGTTTLRVTTVPTGGPGHRFVGVAKKAAAAAGDVIEVVTYGFCLADVAAGVAVDVGLTFSGTVAGEMVAATVDAALIIGAYFGRTLAASQTPPLLTPIFVEHM